MHRTGLTQTTVTMSMNDDVEQWPMLAAQSTGPRPGEDKKYYKSQESIYK